MKIEVNSCEDCLLWDTDPKPGGLDCKHPLAASVVKDGFVLCPLLDEAFVLTHAQHEVLMEKRRVSWCERTRNAQCDGCNHG